MQYTSHQRQLQFFSLLFEALLFYIRFMSDLTYEYLKQTFSRSPHSSRRSISLPNHEHAAVLVPVVRSESTFDLLFTKRTETVETHKGQISFPGGMTDVSDNDIIHTALRETDEEIGLAPSSIEIIGLLDDMATPTGFIITPVVGIIAALPPLRLNKEEVAEVFRVKLDFFATPSSGRTELREFRGRKHEVWYYDCGDHVIWGATAMIIRSLLKRLQYI
jgi:8-oxo-dGTP pyrophosphatase MutT (NUDIX family)